MNLRQLKYFVGVVEAGNMTRAAEQLHVAQPALGMQIRLMEEDLGVALLVRHSRGVEPTKPGSILYTRARAILKLVDEARSEVSACDQDSIEMIRVGMSPSLMLMLGSDLAVNVRDRVPQVLLSLSEEMSHVLAGALSRDEIDIALAYDVADEPQLSRTALLLEDLVYVALPGPHLGKSIAFAETLEERLILPEQRDTNRRLITRIARELALDLKVTHEVRSVAAQKNLVRRGAGATILPYSLVHDEVRNGELDARPIIAPTLTRTLFLVTSVKRRSFRNELALTGIIRSSLKCLTDVLGPLARPILPLDN